MGIFNKNRKNGNGESVEFGNKIPAHEDRQPNHWAYDNDPILNLEPVFADEPGVKDKFKYHRGLHPNKKESGQSAIVKMQDLLVKKGKEVPSEIVEPTQLSNIIGQARNKADQLQKDVIKNDPVIAKLIKIEQLRRTGGTDSDVYTDLSKSNVSYYSQRAKEFHDQNSQLKLESDLERAKRLTKEAENKRKLGKEEIVDDTLIKGKKPKNIGNRVDLYRSKTISNLDKEVSDNTKTTERKRHGLFHKKTIEMTQNLSNEKSKKILQLEEKIRQRSLKLEEYKNKLAKKEQNINELLADKNSNLTIKLREKMLRKQEKDLINKEKQLRLQEKEIDITIANIESNSIFNPEYKGGAIDKWKIKKNN